MISFGGTPRPPSPRATSAMRPWHETLDKGHGRIERRRCAVVDLTAAEWGRLRQPSRATPKRCASNASGEVLNTAKRSIEVTWSLTSLGAERAGPEELLALVRNHWAHRKPSALRARLHRRRRPVPGVRAPPASQPRLPDQRGHLHRALQRPLPLPARGQPALCRPYPGSPRRDPDRAHRPDPAGITAQSGAPGARRRAAWGNSAR